jgi:hypothetical protein
VPKENTFSPLQVKNKPGDGETEHAFILGSTHCTVFNKFGSTAINCPRSLQILYCQKTLFCTLQRIYSSVAIFSDYLIKKSLQFWRGLGCSMQASNF